MGDIDGSSRAAHSAQQSNFNLKRKPVKFLARIAGWFSFGSQAEQLDTNKILVDPKPDPKFFKVDPKLNPKSGPKIFSSNFL